MAMLFLFLMVIAFMLVGVPIAISLGLSSVIFLLMHSDASLASVAQTLFNAFAGHYTLLAIPFFILASSFMSTGGVAKRIIRFAIAMVGWFRGGLAMASVVACMMFAALSGSSPATVVAIGSIVIAGMIKNGYTKEFAAGVICNAGTLGILIPPSIVMVVYAAATDVSVGRMFLGGVIPGLLAGVMLMIAIYIAARIKKIPAQPFVGWGEMFSAAKDASWGLLLIVIILGGIYGGIFTPTEAAAVAAVYAFFIANFIYRDMGPLRKAEGERNLTLLEKPIALVTAFIHRDTRDTLFEAGKLTVTLMFIIANALILKHSPSAAPFTSVANVIEEENQYQTSSRYQDDKRFWQTYCQDMPTQLSMSHRKASTTADANSVLRHISEIDARLLEQLALFSKNTQSSQAYIS